MRFALALAVSFCLPLSARAQMAAAQPLTLRDVIRLAQAQGNSARVARSTRDAARWQDDAFHGRLLPQLYLVGDVADLNRGINPIVLPDGSTQFVGQSQNRSSLGIGFSQALPLTGGSVQVESRITRINQFGAATSQVYQTSPIVVRLRQQLFRPREIVWDRRIQTLNATVADRAYLEAREDVAGEAAEAFFDLYAQQVALANASKNVAVNDTLFTLNKGRYEVGKIGENDLLKSELALLRARAAVDDAQLARDRAEATLRRRADLPVERQLSIVAPDSIPVVDADPEVAVREALKNSPVTRVNELDAVQAKRAIGTARSNNRFNATVDASAGFNQTAPVFGDAYQNPLAAQRVTVGVNVPMLQWGAGRAEVERAKALDARVAANNRLRRETLAQDARFAVLQLQQARRNVVIAAKSDTVAGKQFEVARNRYTTGKISNDVLYQAQSEKDAAVLANVQALRNYWTSYYRLRRVTLYDFERRAELVDEM